MLIPATGRLARRRALLGVLALVVAALCAPHAAGAALAPQTRTTTSMPPSNSTIGRAGLLFRIPVPSTGSEEPFMLFVPDTPQGQPRPLLVCFHVYGASYYDIAANTTFLREARRRGWYLVAPMQLSTVGLAQASFASAQSQLHVEAAIDYVMANHPIDGDRVYGVGFSMGGGNVLSYAARHRDRDRGAFAAIVNHTGTVALGDVYANEPSARIQMHMLFGGSPTQQPFEYQRSSVVELDAGGSLVLGGRHMARNLVDVPIRTYYGIGDPEQYLVDQCGELDMYLQSQIGAQHQLFPVPTQCSTSYAHCWQTLDETETCNWLATHSLGAPSAAGGYLVDRDGRWGSFDVDLVLSDRFGEFEFSVQSVANSLTLDGTENVLRVAADLAQIGLDASQPIEVHTGSIDGSGDRILLEGLGGPPASVTRNGIPVAQTCSGSPFAPSWCYAAQTIELNEISSVGAVWVVTP